MNILGALKNRYYYLRRKRGDELKGKKQFNMKIDENLISYVRDLATTFRVPRFAVTEHLLQTAIYYMCRAMKDEIKRKKIEQHLISRHLLNGPVGDEEVIIKIGEPNLNWLLLDQTKRVMWSFKALKSAVNIAERTGNTYYLDKCQKKLNRSVLGLAVWIEKHRLDETGESPGNSEEGGKENG